MKKNIDDPQTFFIDKEREDENLHNETKSESDFAPDNNLKDTYYQSNFKNTNKSEFKIRHSRYSVNSSSSNYSANTIYKVLNKRKNEFISTIKKHSDNPDQPEDLLTQKRNFFKKQRYNLIFLEPLYTRIHLIILILKCLIIFIASPNGTLTLRIHSISL